MTEREREPTKNVDLKARGYKEGKSEKRVYSSKTLHSSLEGSSAQSASIGSLLAGEDLDATSSARSTTLWL